MNKASLIVFVLLALSLISYADFYSGNDILLRMMYDIKNYKSYPMEEALHFFQALGYIEGVADAYNDIYFDIPDSVLAGQIHAIVKNYLEDHPEELHYSAAYLIRQALQKAFPIKEEKDKEGREK